MNTLAQIFTKWLARKQAGTPEITVSQKIQPVSLDRIFDAYRDQEMARLDAKRNTEFAKWAEQNGF